MTKCPTCGLDATANLCPDPIHGIADPIRDLGDRCEVLEQERDAALDAEEELNVLNRSLSAERDALRAELAEAVALLERCRKDVGAHLHTETCPTCSLWTETVDSFLAKQDRPVVDAAYLAGYAVGAEDMRERAAVTVEECSPYEHGLVAQREVVGDIRALPTEDKQETTAGNTAGGDPR